MIGRFPSIWNAVASIVMLAVLVSASLGQVRQIVTIWPEASLSEQIKYLKNTWPWMHAILVVEIVAAPKCNRPPRGSGTNGITTYCSAGAQAVTTLLVKHPGSDDPFTKPFRLHYWYPKESERRRSQIGLSPVRVVAGRRYIVFLAPTKAATRIFACTVVMEEDAEALGEIRRLLE